MEGYTCISQRLIFITICTNVRCVWYASVSGLSLCVALHNFTSRYMIQSTVHVVATNITSVVHVPIHVNATTAVHCMRIA